MQDALLLQDTLPKQESGRGNPAQSVTAAEGAGGGGAWRAGSVTNAPGRGLEPPPPPPPAPQLGPAHAPPPPAAQDTQPPPQGRAAGTSAYPRFPPW